MVEPGKAPFCGNFRKCNNGEGCDCCKEFEEWLAAEERHRYDPIAGDD